MNDSNKIIEVLSRTANLLKNAGKGDKEKAIEVSFVKKDNSILIDHKKFIDPKTGELIINEKAIKEEQGRLLIRSELDRSFTKKQREELMK